MEIKIKKLHPSAKIPSFALPGDAGMDLYSTENYLIKPNEKVGVKTGIAMELPTGFVGLVWDKSGIAINKGVKTLGGVIDSGYRGEIVVGLVNLGNQDFLIEKGQKVAQILIQKIEQPEIVLVDSLTDTTRGTGGFGSTGKN